MKRRSVYILLYKLRATFTGEVTSHFAYFNSEEDARRFITEITDRVNPKAYVFGNFVIFKAKRVE